MRYPHWQVSTPPAPLGFLPGAAAARWRQAPLPAAASLWPCSGWWSLSGCAGGDRTGQRLEVRGYLVPAGAARFVRGVLAAEPLMARPVQSPIQLGTGATATPARVILAARRQSGSRRRGAEPRRRSGASPARQSTTSKSTGATRRTRAD